MAQVDLPLGIELGLIRAEPRPNKPQKTKDTINMSDASEQAWTEDGCSEDAWTHIDDGYGATQEQQKQEKQIY